MTTVVREESGSPSRGASLELSMCCVSIVHCMPNFISIPHALLKRLVHSCGAFRLVNADDSMLARDEGVEVKISSRSTLAVLLQFKVAHGMLRSDLTQRLRSHLTQHAGMGSEAKVIELAGGKSGHLKLLGPL